MQEQLKQFRSKIPFLQYIPDDIYFSLSSEEWYLPNQKINTLRLFLEKELNQYVMAYRREVFAISVKPEQHLCGMIKGARLNNSKLSILNWFEKITKTCGVSFVIYKKPIEVIDVRESTLYTYYQKNNLL